MAKSPKFAEGDVVFLGDKAWEVEYFMVYNESVTYVLIQQSSYSKPAKRKFDVEEVRLHRLSLSERLARIEAALNLD